MSRYKTLGIIGGAGPEAGALLYSEIIRQLQKKYGFAADKDFPRIILLSYPFSDMLTPESSEKNRSVLQCELQEAVDLLSKVEIDVFGIACNTLHVFMNAIDIRKMRFVSIVESAGKKLKNLYCKNALFLGTTTSIVGGLYQSVSDSVIYPSNKEQEFVINIINKVLENSIEERDAFNLLDLVNEMQQKTKIDSVILGCTELSVLHRKYPALESLKIPIIDTIEVLAQELISLTII